MSSDQMTRPIANLCIDVPGCSGRAAQCRIVRPEGGESRVDEYGRVRVDWQFRGFVGHRVELGGCDERGGSRDVGSGFERSGDDRGADRLDL